MSSLEALLRERGFFEKLKSKSPDQEPSTFQKKKTPDQEPKTAQKKKSIQGKTITAEPRKKTKLDELLTAKGRKRKREEIVEDDRGQKHSTRSERVNDDEELRRIQNMEKKAKLYDRLQKGDVADAENKYNVDFDRKYAEALERGEEPAESDGDKDDGPEEIEYYDEFGRRRKMTKKEYEKQKKMEEFREEFSAFPLQPQNLHYGDFIQTDTRRIDDLNKRLEEVRKKNEELNSKVQNSYFNKDEVRHYQRFQESMLLIDWKHRRHTYGPSYVRLSHDEEERQRQIEELEQEHKNTVRLRELLAKSKKDGGEGQDASKNVEDPSARLENENAAKNVEDPFAKLEKENGAKNVEDPFAVLERQVLEKEAEVERRAEEFVKDLEHRLYGD
jgi:hypothetical protein